MILEKKFLPKLKARKNSDKTVYYIEYYTADNERVRTRLNHLATAEMRSQELKKVYDSVIEVHTNGTVGKLEKEVIRLKYQWRKKTFETYLSKVRCFERWLKKRPVTQKNVEAFFDHLLQVKKLSGISINKYITVLSILFKGLGYEILMERVKVHKEHCTPARYFSPHQIPVLKNAMLTYKPELWLFCQCIYYTYIRPGELRVLKVGDILFDEKKIRVRGEISKNKKTEYVVIPDPLIPLLLPLATLPPSYYVFGRLGKPGKKIMSTNYMTGHHLKVLRKLGFTDEYKLYSWKHTGAVAAVKAGINIKVLQLQLRHHSLDQVDEYIRQLGLSDFENLGAMFPAI